VSLHGTRYGVSATPFRTFVVADLRGYTRYSAAFGDEAAAAVAVKFAGIAAKVAEASTEGGFLGFGGVKVSDAEKATLADIAKALGTTASA